MTQEQKELLLKDLCARLPYGVKLNVKFYDISNDNELKTKDLTLGDGNIGFIIRKSHWIEYKPYLRPTSSMTEDEEIEYDKTFIHLDGLGRVETFRTFDWLNAHHFDYRCLIEDGLALPALEGMYK